jgi:hypothetical protein
MDGPDRTLKVARDSGFPLRQDVHELAARTSRQMSQVGRIARPTPASAASRSASESLARTRPRIGNSSCWSLPLWRKCQRSVGCSANAPAAKMAAQTIAGTAARAGFRSSYTHFMSRTLRAPMLVRFIDQGAEIIADDAPRADAGVLGRKLRNIELSGHHVPAGISGVEERVARPMKKPRWRGHFTFHRASRPRSSFTAIGGIWRTTA